MAGCTQAFADRASEGPCSRAGQGLCTLAAARHTGQPVLHFTVCSCASAGQAADCDTRPRSGKGCSCVVDGVTSSMTEPRDGRLYLPALISVVLEWRVGSECRTSERVLPVNLLKLARISTETLQKSNVLGLYSLKTASCQNKTRIESLTGSCQVLVISSDGAARGAHCAALQVREAEVGRREGSPSAQLTASAVASSNAACTCDRPTTVPLSAASHWPTRLIVLPQHRWSWPVCVLVRMPFLVTAAASQVPRMQYCITTLQLHQSCGNSTPDALHSHADRDAQVLDFVQFNRRAALNSSLKHSACSYLPPKDAVPGGDEAIHMYPFDLSPQCEVRNLARGRTHQTCVGAPLPALPCNGWSACLCWPSRQYQQAVRAHRPACPVLCWHAGHAAARISTPQPLPAERPGQQRQAAVQDARAGAGRTGSAGAERGPCTPGAPARQATARRSSSSRAPQQRAPDHGHCSSVHGALQAS